MELQSYQQGSTGIFPCMIADCWERVGLEPTCDSRYRDIISQLDVMIETLRRHPGRSLLAELVHLLQVMRHQCGAENTSMELVGYPGAMLHSQRHQSICTFTAKLCYRFEKSQYLQLSELVDLRFLWLEHIKEHDQAFEAFLIS